MSRLRQRRRAVALWRYEQRCEALNGVRISCTPPAMWLDDKPVWLAPVLRRFTGAIRPPKPARTPRVWRRLSALPAAWQYWLYGNRYARLIYWRPKQYGKSGLSNLLRVPYGGA